jgi:hypothetical protein
MSSELIAGRSDQVLFRHWVRTLLPGSRRRSRSVYVSVGVEQVLALIHGLRGWAQNIVSSNEAPSFATERRALWIFGGNKRSLSAASLYRPGGRFNVCRGVQGVRSDGAMVGPKAGGATARRSAGGFPHSGHLPPSPAAGRASSTGLGRARYLPGTGHHTGSERRTRSWTMWS